MRKFFSAAILLVLVSTASACAQLEDEVPSDTADFDWSTASAERIWVEGRSLEGGAALPGASAEGACACTSPECFDQWVIDAIGCDVCVAVVCDGQTVAHSCTPCDDSPIHQGDGWHGDGRVE